MVCRDRNHCDTVYVKTMHMFVYVDGWTDRQTDTLILLIKLKVFIFSLIVLLVVILSL